MAEALKKDEKKMKIIWAVKILSCFLILVWIFNNLFLNGLKPYLDDRDYFYQNDAGEMIPGADITSIEQQFIASGNILSNITFYLKETEEKEVFIEIVDSNQKTVSEKCINLKDYVSDSWNRIAIDCDGLKREGAYTLHISGNGLSNHFLFTSNVYPECFKECSVNGNIAGYVPAMGLQFTYQYMLLGYGFELAVRTLFAAIIAAALCYAVIFFEKVLECFRGGEKKKGFWYALYFSVHTVLLFNPLDKIRNEVTDFGKVIGQGIKEGVDVTRRISNFNQWFLCFAVLFFLFLILANYFKSRERSGESRKAVALLDNIIIIADMILGLRCIIFFQEEEQTASIFYYSDFFLMLTIFLVFSYILFGMEHRISLIRFEGLLLCGWMLSLPVSIAVTQEWVLGRVFMGIQVLVSIVIVFVVQLTRVDWSKNWIACGIDTCAAFLSLIPLGTSFYIEFVAILNQHGIFWVHLRRNYFYAIAIGIVFTFLMAFVCLKRKINVSRWKSFAYPAVIFGFSCLWQQIPISSTYKVDILETANFSVLISDFLNYGDIPIVQHYGGHMMTGVWEGILYALFNHDFVGASFSPYSGYVAAVIAVAFYLLVKRVWDEDAALFTVLFFPFYDPVSYWGLGILTALAAMAYVRKNTYFRAAVFWFVFIWCTLYRLDLGFAFGAAGLIGLGIYVAVSKNRRAFRQLAVTLMGWLLAGLLLWFGICLVQGLDPVKRLMEFLLISLSNQNWAFTRIGDHTVTKFAVVYLFIPFIMIIMVLYMILCKRIKEHMGTDCWIAILIIGISYFINFSRGLVRHSLAENALEVCIWSSLLFIPLFITSIKGNRKLFLPAFTACVFCYTFLMTGNNFADRSIADAATGRIGSYTETWMLSRFAEEEAPEGERPITYWARVRENREVIGRVEWDGELKKIIQDYQTLIDALLEEDETFVDCTSRTSIYPLLNRRNPVYASQSPLQLSGQYTQEQFIDEIENVPIALMPYDWGSDRTAEELDGVPNIYRHYKVFEYIYQNFLPLCTYESAYTIWCRSERYEEMRNKVDELILSGTDIKEQLALSGNIQYQSVDRIVNSDGSINLNVTGTDPMVSELQNLIDLSPYVDKNLTIAVDYESDVLEELQVFYTTEEGESYTEDKISSVRMKGETGRVYFKVPVTAYTRLRFDIPEGAQFKITAFRIGACNCRLVERERGGIYTEDPENPLYLSTAHNYNLNQLPMIWAEKDKEKSVENSIITSLAYQDGVYCYALQPSEYGKDGNYLKVSMEYAGEDRSGYAEGDDESFGVSMKVGKMVNGQLETKYTYTFTVKEGRHDYMFRISNNYHWYLGETNAVMLESDRQLLNVNMEILEGD